MGAWRLIEPRLLDIIKHTRVEDEIGAEKLYGPHAILGSAKPAASSADWIAAITKKEQEAIFDGVFAKVSETCSVTLILLAIDLTT